MSDDLSRLLAGELDPAEADALRARIAADPDLAARWARMQALPGRLAALGRTLPGQPAARVPGARGAAVSNGHIAGEGPTAGPSPRLRRGEGGRRPDEGNPRGSESSNAPLPRRGALRRLLPRLGTAALGAVAALALVWLRPAPEHVLVSGTERVSGRADVLAGDVLVEVNGTARITVEPPASGGREVDAEIDPMDRTHLLAALAGSIVTVAVSEGHAWLHPAAPAGASGPAATRETEPIEVSAGETRSVGGHGGRGEPRTPGARPDRGARAGKDDRAAALEAESARLRAEAARGAPEAVPKAWPEDVGAAWRPAAFERFMDERIPALPGITVLDVDCSEYPCVAILETTSEADNWEAELRPLEQGLEGTFGPGATAIGKGYEMSIGEDTVRLYGFVVVPPDGPADARTELTERTRAILRVAAAELLGQ